MTKTRQKKQAHFDALRGSHVFMPGFDEHGQPVERPKHSNPYSYSPFVVFRGGQNDESNGTIYSDRLLSWDRAKHDALCLIHFGGTGHLWNNRSSTAIEAFLRDWTGDPELRLILVMECCNVSSGYPVWRFDYAKKTEKTS